MFIRTTGQDLLWDQLLSPTKSLPSFFSKRSWKKEQGSEEKSVYKNVVFQEAVVLRDLQLGSFIRFMELVSSLWIAACAALQGESVSTMMWSLPCGLSSKVVLYCRTNKAVKKMFWESYHCCLGIPTTMMLQTMNSRCIPTDHCFTRLTVCSFVLSLSIIFHAHYCIYIHTHTPSIRKTEVTFYHQSAVRNICSIFILRWSSPLTLDAITPDPTEEICWYLKIRICVFMILIIYSENVYVLAFMEQF